MYTITYDIQVGIYYHRNIVENFEDRDVANSRWIELKKNISVLNMRHSSTEEPEQFIAVQVLFNNYGKKYTYLSTSTVEVGQLVVVRTQDGLQVVTCVSCNKVSKSTLETILPFNKFKYITGKVV